MIEAFTDNVVRGSITLLDSIRGYGPSFEVKGSGREHLMTIHDDPRFLPFSVATTYDVGDDVQTIDRTYGTVEQGLRYPKYTELVGLGVKSLPKAQFKLA